jgi:succinate dehydrogenase / fumarate reductase iron-sulfur subunit
MDAAGFGNCTNHYECEAACPKEIDRDVMAQMYRDYAKSSLLGADKDAKDGGSG